MGNDISSTWKNRHRLVVGKAASRPHDPQYGIVFSHGKGALLWDVNGRDYVDLTCGYSTTSFGHCFEPFVEVASHSLRKISHLTGDLHTGQIELAESLVQLAESEFRTGHDSQWKVMLNATGARAVETAWKASQAYRPGALVCLGPGFHGKSLATTPLSDFGVFQPNANGSGEQSLGDVEPGQENGECFPGNRFVNWTVNEYPYCEKCPFNDQYPQCELKCSSSLFGFLENHAQSISAVLVEPVLGARGFVFPPDDFFRKLRATTQKRNILMIADEIQSGLGRCGEMLLSTAQGWTPDLLVLGKTLGGGIAPISACLGRSDVLDSLPIGSETETFSASPLACSVAVEVLKQLREEDWIQRGKSVGEKLRQFLREKQFQTYSPFPSNSGRVEHQRGEGRVESVESDLPLQSSKNAFSSFSTIGGRGASCTIEFAVSGVETEEAARNARRFSVACYESQILVHLTGPSRTRVVMLPPLTIDIRELDLAMERLSHAIERFLKIKRSEHTG